MPGTTRYSATFDRTYDEDEVADVVPPVARRSRSQSLQVESFTDHNKTLYNTNGNNGCLNGSHSSTEMPPKGAGPIPTRTVGKPTVKPHNNPFQFVKVGTCPLYKKAEEQLKKVQEVKKPEVIKEDEEEWQSNLDSWKSRRRKMSEGTFKRQEEIRQLQQEELLQQHQQQQKKIKTFTEIVEERAHRGRALSLCLFSNPLESNEWVFENKTSSRRISCHASEESAESSNINSEDDNDSFQKHIDNLNSKMELTNGSDLCQNGVQTSTSNSSISKNSDLSEFDASQDLISHKDHVSGNAYIDSGLESLSSSHRMGDIHDSGSDFSQDSASSIGCDSPRVSGIITTGIELLEEFSSNEDLLKQSVVTKQKSPEKLVNGSRSKEMSPDTKHQASTDDKRSSKEKTRKPKLSKKPVSATKNVQDNNSSDVKSSGFTEHIKEPALVDSRQKDSRAHTNADSSQHLSKSSAVSEQVKSCSDSENSSSSVISSCSRSSFSLIEEVPVEKVTEEMERLILQQLEEDELAKEINTNVKSVTNDNIDIPVKHVAPPKEKPPPPPIESPASQNSNKLQNPSVKRTNSTKRILKEIHRRRTDFLGIEEPEPIDSIHDEQLSLQAPPALQDLLKAEQEENRKFQSAILENLAPAPLSPSTSEEEEEIARKEREIIANLERDEKMVSQGISTVESLPSNDTSLEIEEDRIKRLKEERKRIEEERVVAEEQRVRVEEARLLQQREQQIREQEAKAGSLENEDAVSKSCANSEAVTNKDNDSLLSNGDGSNALNSSSSSPLLASVTSELSKAKEANPPPPTAPKPLKKKEAIRKERERLRYEQEVLQREREEHRRKIQLEQEQLKKKLQKPQVASKPSVCQVEPSPSPKKPLPQPPSSQIMPHSQHAIHKEAPGQVRTLNGNIKTSTGPHLPSQPKIISAHNKQNGVPIPRSRNNAPEVRTKPKVPSARKNPELSSEGRYNQNHWLIQEAEMRRIAEQKERQRSQSHNDLRHNGSSQNNHHNPPIYNDSYNPSAAPKPAQRPSALPLAQNCTNYAVPMQYSPEKSWNSVPQLHQGIQNKRHLSQSAQHVNYDMNQSNLVYSSSYDVIDGRVKTPPAKPSRGALLEKHQEQMLSVSGRKRCSHCGDELGRGAAMIIESLQLYYHIQCFKCCVCHAQLGNGSCGTDVRVRSSKLHCHNCYSNDEAGLKFSQV